MLIYEKEQNRKGKRDTVKRERKRYREERETIRQKDTQQREIEKKKASHRE